MDDIYEFENSEYRLASMQIKAIAYDVMTGITRKKVSLKNSGRPEDLLEELTTISDKIIELTDSLENEFQKLDQIEEERKIITTEDKKNLEKTEKPIKKRTLDVIEKKDAKEESKPTIEDNKEDKSKEPEQTDNVKQEKAPVEEKIKIDIPKPEDTKIEETTREVSDEDKLKENELPIENNTEKGHFVIPLSAFKNTTSDKSKESVAATEANKKTEPIQIESPMTEEHGLSLPNLNIKTESATTSMESERTTNEPELSAVQQETSEPATSSVGQEINESVEIEEKTSAKKRFQKQTKNLSKAIMVRPNQLANLRKSHDYQEQLLASQGIFEIKTNIEEKQATINKKTKELPDDVERQIEDLTVKANIYYNEGEVDKAQELYDKIRKLNEQYR